MGTFKTIKQHEIDTMTQKEKLVSMIKERIPNSIEPSNAYYLDILKFDIQQKGFWFWKYKEWKQIVLFDVYQINKTIYLTSYTPVVSEEIVELISKFLKRDYEVVYKFIDKNYVKILNDKTKYDYDY